MTFFRFVSLTLALVVLTAPRSGIAQQTHPKTEKAVSLTGCLTKASENGHQLTVITTSTTTPVTTTTTVYRLIAVPPAAEIKQHEDHRVTVTGWLTGPPPKGVTSTPKNESSTIKPQAVTEVRVKDILHVADSCR